MADNKVEKALYGPSTTEVALGAVLGLIAGLAAACVYLVLKPVQQVKELPKEPERGAIYFIPGSEQSGKNRNWSAKQKTFAGGGSVEVVEDELNAWAKAAFPASPAGAAPGKAPAAKGGEAAKPASEGGIFQPGTPNFQIKDGKLRIAAPCFINWYGVGQQVFVIATGDIKRSGNQFEFEPESVYLGSCPVHLLPGVAGPLFSHLIGKKKVSDEINSAWAKLTDVSIEGSTLKLTVQ